MVYDTDVKAFIEEREKKIGGKLIWRTYATWFAELAGERREWGVFLYSDGRSLIIEDFFRPSTILGYEIKSKSEKEREEAYVKLEIALPLSDVRGIEYCSRRSAEKSLKTINDVSKSATLLNKIFTKNCTKLVVGERIFFFELPSYKEFKKLIDKNKEF